MATTYLTVAIPYVNAAPHLGYAYELVLADVAARARRGRPGDQVRLLGGTDDHSLKNVLAAEAAGVAIADLVATHADRFAALAGPLSIGFDDFLRTSSDPRHAPAVTRLWRAADRRGDLYRRRYRGDYCVGCEQFYAPAELVGGCCPEHRTPTEVVEEDNWFFRLSRYQEDLEAALASGRLAVTPEPFRAEALAWVRSGLSDVSVSRSARRARGWGIPVPGQPDQVVYVWFDALACYLSGLDYGTPGSAAFRRWWTDADQRIHVVGKGILRFHAVLWPALLASAGEAWPTRVHVHPYLSVGGAKLSKSSGTAVEPSAVVAEHGTDALRWWFARDVSPTVDTDFSPERLVARANEELAGGFGNLVSRITALVHRHRAGVVPPVATAPLPEVDRLADRVGAALADLDPRGGTRLLIDAVGAVNRDLERRAPWVLARDPQQSAALDEVLARSVAGAAEVARALEPVLPDLGRRLSAQLAGPGRTLPPPLAAYPRRSTTGTDRPSTPGVR